MILNYIKLHDPKNNSNTVVMYNSFEFRNHLIIVTELLSYDLYNFLTKIHFRGLNIDLVRRFSC